MITIVLAALGSSAALYLAQYLAFSDDSRKKPYEEQGDAASLSGSAGAGTTHPENCSIDDTASMLTDPEADAKRRRRKSMRKWRMVGCAVAATGGLQLAAMGYSMLVRKLRSQTSSPASHRNKEPHTTPRERSSSHAHRLDRIPLSEVIRFKERQWFLEELEASQDGDANAMLRLSKQYLHGQGCQKSLASAAEWLRKARALGIYATLDELYAGDDLRREVAEQSHLRDPRPSRAAGALGRPVRKRQMMA